MILILTDKFDSHSDYIIEKLISRSISFFRLNLDYSSLLETHIKFDGQFEISQNGEKITSSKITKVWPRRLTVEITAEEECEFFDDTTFRIWRNEWNKTIRNFFFTIEHADWLNTPSAINKTENKLKQLCYAKMHGFNVPDFIITNQKSDLIDFSRQYPSGVALKLQHQDFYKINERNVGFYVNKISTNDLNEFQLESENPIMLQKYIDKLYEARITVINEEFFYCKIESQHSKKAQIDWRRYDIGHTPHTQQLAPKEIQDQVKGLMQSLGIIYGAFDFIIAPDEKWYFLEVNSTGQWLWIEYLTDLKISEAIIDWMQS